MTLSEKIFALRSKAGLSQGDLAEKLEVSRQSVSKWETGQSVPDLDKIIKLADLFGVSVDELVREDARPEPHKSEPGLDDVLQREDENSRTHIVVGFLLELIGIGALMILIPFRHELGPELIPFGIVPVVAGLPLLFAKKHPWLICGWLTLGMSYLFLNRWNDEIGILYLLRNLSNGYVRDLDHLALLRFCALLLMVAATRKSTCNTVS